MQSPLMADVRLLKSRAGGFTLIELLVVMVLAAMTVAVVGAGAKAFMERSQYHQAIREVSTILNSGRSLAIREGHMVAVTFDPVGRMLAIGSNAAYAIPAHLDVQWGAMEVGATDGVLPVVFSFNPDGSGYGGRFEVFRGGRGVSFRLNWLIGSVEQDEVISK